MRAKKPSLHLVEDDMLLKSFILNTKTCSIGRSNENDFVVDNKLVSRNHARISVENDSYTIEDLSSANGTFVNGKAIRSTTLKHGDEIGIGEFILIFDEGQGIKGVSDQTRIDTPGEETRSIVNRYESLAQKIRHQGIVKELKTYHKEVLKSRKKLVTLANKDRLTGVFNRAYFDKMVVHFHDEARQAGSPFSLIFIDVDFFKKVNDTFGHSKGDEVLKVLAQLMRTSLRQDDIVARYGGEEFVILCMGMASGDACMTADALRKIIEKTTPEILNLKITVSAGVASFPEHCLTVKELINGADQALYQAKTAGRNRVAKYNA